VFCSNTLNILARSYLSFHRAILAKLKPTPNRTNLAAQSKYVYMTQEAIKPKKQVKQNCDDSVASNKRTYPKYE
jgi:hypothetical protein